MNQEELQELEDKKDDIKKSLATSRYELELLKLLEYDKFYWSYGRNSKQDVIIDDDGIESQYEVKAQTQEGFMNIFSIKSLSLLGVLFALFFVFASSQLETVVKGVPYLSNPQLNVVARGLLFVVVYFILDKFVL